MTPWLRSGNKPPRQRQRWLRRRQTRKICGSSFRRCGHGGVVLGGRRWGRQAGGMCECVWAGGGGPWPEVRAAAAERAFDRQAWRGAIKNLASLELKKPQQLGRMTRSCAGRGGSG
eukprot:349973-Chlamydomonas_euryale.AAC.2